MPIKPDPYKVKCPNCGYSKVVSPKSDALNPSDFINKCPKCGTYMEETTLSEVEKFIDKIFRR